jgi:hypothetical protein
MSIECHDTPSRPLSCFHSDTTDSLKMQYASTIAILVIVPLMLLFVIVMLTYDCHVKRSKRKAAQRSLHMAQAGLNPGGNYQPDLEAGTGGLRPLRLATLPRESATVARPSPVAQGVRVPGDMLQIPPATKPATKRVLQLRAQLR